MQSKPRNSGSLVGGAILIIFGLMALMTQIFRGFDFWGTFWPFIIIGVGALFFVGMFAAGRSASGLAIPATIITVIGLMLFVQNLTNHWESWAYGWAVIVMAVGAGIYIMGVYGRSAEQRRGGAVVMRIGLILFVIFGAFFEMLFKSSTLAQYVFPIGLIALGLYLVIRRSGLPPAKSSDDQSTEPPTL